MELNDETKHWKICVNNKMSRFICPFLKSDLEIGIKCHFVRPTSSIFIYCMTVLQNPAFSSEIRTCERPCTAGRPPPSERTPHTGLSGRMI